MKTWYQLPCHHRGSPVINLFSFSVTDILASCDDFDNDVEALCPLPNSEFNSPLQVTPLFRSLGAWIPSPQFSESVSPSSIFVRLLLQYFEALVYLKIVGA